MATLRINWPGVPRCEKDAKFELFSQVYNQVQHHVPSRRPWTNYELLGPWVICSHFISLNGHFVSLCGRFVSLCNCFLSLRGCFAPLCSHFASICNRFLTLCVCFALLCGHLIDYPIRKQQQLKHVAFQL